MFLVSSWGYEVIIFHPRRKGSKANRRVEKDARAWTGPPHCGWQVGLEPSTQFCTFYHLWSWLLSSHLLEADLNLRWLVVTMGRTTRLGRNGQKMDRRPWKRLLHFFSVWFSWFSETESGCCDNGANLLVIDSNLDSIYAFQLSDGVPNASIRCFIFHSIPDIAWALQSILIKEGERRKTSTKDHFVNSVTQSRKVPIVGPNFDKYLHKEQTGELFICRS